MVLKRVLVNAATYSSDVFVTADHQKAHMDQTRKSKCKHANPETSSYIFFPGQGSQYVGMAKELIQYPEGRRIFELANKILGYVDSSTWVKETCF